ncbi:hypothetical protein K402DRAFT_404803 [Aulographum hederae CBS 113979]|uniref:RING-type domain-containing protein n=1 Tax=Aulographum hederae CBS 113979 TaxID=1176131 RepID=A0A6G1GYY9_9PEZI|nr:hypothetical protein K402DRAFT_404803 [Aulographum hederae CBS 113979]
MPLLPSLSDLTDTTSVCTSIAPSETSTSHPNCPICWRPWNERPDAVLALFGSDGDGDPGKEPLLEIIRTSCGHNYHRECLRHVADADPRRVLCPMYYPRVIERDLRDWFLRQRRRVADCTYTIF